MFAARFGIGVWMMPEPEGDRLMMMAFVTVLLIVGIGMALNSFKAKICFTTDAVELTSLISKKSLPLSAIRRRREKVNDWGEEGSTRYSSLIPRDEGLPTLRFITSYDFDQDFHRWFNGLTDLDAEEMMVRKDAGIGRV